MSAGHPAAATPTTRLPAHADLGDGVRLSTLPSGVRVVTETMPDVRSVAVGFWAAIGSRDEEAPVEGASHFLEHLLFKGTDSRGPLQIAEVMDAVGGDMNAFTSKEYTCFYARCLDRDLPKAVDVLSDMISSSLIEPDDVEAERDVVLEEIRMHMDAPDDLAHSEFATAWHGPGTLGREVLGSADSIGAMTRDQVHAYYRQHYVSANLIVAIAGNVAHDDCVRLVESTLGVPSVDETTVNREPVPAAEEPVRLRARPTEQVHLVLGGAGLSRTDERRFAVHALNQALGGGMASRLFQEIRERRGLAYSVYTHPSMYTDTGTFSVYVGTAPRNTEQVLELVRAELATVRDQGLTEAEFARAKGHLAGSIVLALENTSSRMVRLGKAFATGSSLLSVDEVLAAIEAVTPAQVAEVADAVLSGPFSLALVGPLDGAPDDYRDYAEMLGPAPSLEGLAAGLS